MTPGEFDRHVLSPDENEHILRERIWPLVLPVKLKPTDHPTFIMLGGQPGAGKTGLLIAAREELGREGATVSIVGDDLRGFHPGYRSLQRTDPENSALATNPDAGRWVERLLEEARERRVNVVLETTMRQPENVARILTAFQAAGYRTEARVVAVPERESWQGVHLRYEAALAAGGPGAARFTLKAVHDAAAVGMLASLERIEEQGLADRVAVYRRSGETVYENERQTGTWRAPARAADAVVEERERPGSDATQEAFSQNWERVLQQMNARSAPAAAIAAVERQANEDDRTLTEQLRGRTERLAAVDLILIPARRVAPLSEAEIAGRLAASIALSEQREAILRSARIAYGDEALTISARLVAAAESAPRSARATATALVAEPEHFGDLAGRAGGLLRGEDEGRRTARGELPRLAQAVENYGAAVEQERRAILEAHARDVHRQGQTVSISRDLQAALAAPPVERDRRIAESASLRDEVGRVSATIENRLTSAEHRAVRETRTGTVARALGLAPAEARALTATYRQVLEVTARVAQEQRRERVAGRSLQRTM